MELITRIETYKVSSEEEALKLIEKFKNAAGAEGYEVTKSGYVMKTKKSKGEIVDLWYNVTITCNYEA